MHGFGPVEREQNEPAFHADWERVMVAIQRATGGHGLYTIDEFRYGIERMDPAHYLASSYYEHWLDGISRILIEKGVIAPDELDARTAYFSDHPDAPLPPTPATPAAPPISRTPRTSRRDQAAPPRFAAGDAVQTRHDAPRGHTRLPRYARGKRGVIAALHGTHVFPDSNARGSGEQPQPLYSVRFAGDELWGASAEPRQVVHIDLWESYLLPA
jgi:nitrile hydratase